MRSKVTVVLLFLNVVLFYYIFQFEDRVKIHENSRRVLGSEAAGIDGFTRTSPTVPTIAAEKRDENWWLTQPFEWPANPNAIARIVNELQFLEHETSFAVADLAKTNQSLADYGLENPALTLSFRSGGRDFPLRIGDRTEIGNRLYVLSPDGARIHVVNRSLADSLGLDLAQLRSNSIFTVPVFEVRSLAIQTAAPANLRIRLRREGPRWLFETPILARANKNEAELAINGLNALQVRRFLDTREADPGRTGLASPQLRITLEGNSRRETLLIGLPVAPPTADQPAASLEVFAKIEDKAAVFVTAISPRLLETLRTAQESLREQRVLDFEPASVTALTLAAPDQPEINLQRLEQSTEGWQLVVRAAGGQAPATQPADTEVVATLLQRLQLLAATRFLSDAPSAADLENYGFNRPVREFTLHLSTGGGLQGSEPTTVTLQIGAKPGERAVAYARVTNAPFVYQIEPDLLEDVPVDALFFRQRLLRELPEGTRITALRLVDLTRERTLVEKSAPADNALTPATIVAGETDEARRTTLTTLLQNLRRLRAKRFVTDRFDREGTTVNGETVAWRYRLELSLSLTGGVAQNVTSALYLSDRLGGTTQLAGTEEFNGVTFEITQELIDAIFALTYAPQHDPGAPSAESLPPGSP